MIMMMIILIVMTMIMNNNDTDNNIRFAIGSGFLTLGFLESLVRLVNG